MTVQGLLRPEWWKGDFDTTGKTQLGWAKDAAAYSVTSVTPKRHTVTPTVTPSQGAERTRRWRERKQALSAE